MPALPRISSVVLADLANQLRFASPEAARRHVEHAEALATIIDLDQPYPEDWLVSVITGYRPDLAQPALVAGAALLRDLGPLVERLSVAARFASADVAGWPGVPELMARWRVSRRTLERYRRLGLTARVVRVTPAALHPPRGGHTRLAFAPAGVAWFESRHPALLAAAGAFNRVDPARRATVLKRARRYRAALGWSRAAAARRLAATLGGSAAAIERLLVRYDARAASPIFPRRAPLPEAQARAVERWLRRGASVSAVARRVGRTPAGVRRLALGVRLAALAELALPIEEGAPAIDLARPAPALTLGLGRPPAATLAELLARTEAEGWPDAGAERDRALAFRALRGRAASAIAALIGPGDAQPLPPSAAAIDAIFTDLRWAARLKVELVGSQQRLLLATLEGRLGRGIVHVPGGVAASALDAGFAALLEAVERFDPSKGGRLAGPANVMLARALARWSAGPGAGWAVVGPAAAAPLRASLVIDPSAVALADWTTHAAAWQSLVEPDPRVRAGLVDLDDFERRVLMLRFGWLVGPPLTRADLAAELGITPLRAARAERRAIARALRPAAKSSPKGRL